jgi:hypothetical protein
MFSLELVEVLLVSVQVVPEYLPYNGVRQENGVRSSALQYLAVLLVPVLVPVEQKRPTNRGIFTHSRHGYVTDSPFF